MPLIVSVIHFDCIDVWFQRLEDAQLLHDCQSYIRSEDTQLLHDCQSYITEQVIEGDTHFETEGPRATNNVEERHWKHAHLKIFTTIRWSRKYTANDINRIKKRVGDNSTTCYEVSKH